MNEYDPVEWSLNEFLRLTLADLAIEASLNSTIEAPPTPQIEVDIQIPRQYGIFKE